MRGIAPRHSGARETSKPGTTLLKSASRMIEMKTHFTGLAVAALLVVAPALPGYAEDAAAPAAPAPTAQTPAATQTQAPPPSVPRPSLAPKTAEPASAPADAEPAPRHHRRYAHRHWRRYAYWEPFPIYWPHLYRNRIHWSRIPWNFNF
jgi:hypothetical protein